MITFDFRAKRNLPPALKPGFRGWYLGPNWDLREVDAGRMAKSQILSSGMFKEILQSVPTIHKHVFFVFTYSFLLHLE